MGMDSTILHQSIKQPKWWQTAVIYQIYPRSFADGDGDGIGDLRGVESRLESLQALGIDAIWFSPFFKSPQKDAGYDVSDYRSIDPLFGTNEDFDKLLAKAKSLGIRIIVDLVPNHSSDQHELFQKALKAAPGSPERDMYMFRDGKGENGELPPNNWESVFGGQAWSRITEADGSLGQWYLHIFDSSQPDFNWENPKVHEFFAGVLRFWLDKGVDGFRIDVAHGLVKAPGLPNITAAQSQTLEHDPNNPHPFWGQEGVHDIIRSWRKILDEYDDRAMCAEAWVLPLSRMAKWVRPDEYHQTFNFGYLETPWAKEPLVKVITDSLEAFGSVGAPSTWVLSNHDVIRHVSRFGVEKPPPQGSGIGPGMEQPDEELGQRRGRAATAFMLGIPGGAYLYQGEELGLPEHTTLEGKYRQDPTFSRTKGERVGRDGCRVPLPWEADGGVSFGFNSTGESWLPAPATYKKYARDVQEGVAGSTLELYKKLITERKKLALGSGEFRWAPEYSSANSLAYVNNGVLVLSNFGPELITVPAGEVIVSTQSSLTAGGQLEANQSAWIKL
ncbi:MAG: glycoside hydrolase family 13 protein [Rhodoluna sp.]|nr:glycoside hydrolase family 13 protein [Rhodoluna sp.]